MGSLPWFVLLWHPSYPWGAKKGMPLHRIEHEVRNKLRDTFKQNRIGHKPKFLEANSDAKSSSATNTPGSQSQTAVF